MKKKLKVWDKEQNKFLDINWQNEDDRFTTGKANINVTSEGEIYFTISNKTDEDGWPYEVDANILQYTGITDKDGKELCEGDIYHQGDPNIRYVVVWNDTGLMGKQIGSNSYAGLSYWKDKIELLGNSYENPELMKQTK